MIMSSSNGEQNVGQHKKRSNLYLILSIIPGQVSQHSGRNGLRYHTKCAPVQ